MTAEILNGRAVAKTIEAELKTEITAMGESGVVPALAVMQVGGDPASAWYVGQIRKSCKRVGVMFRLETLPQNATAEALAGALEGLNQDAGVHGVIVQMPLPRHLSQEIVTDTLDPRKDVDGIHPVNAGRLFQGSSHYFAPATPAGGMELMRRYGIELKGKRAVMVGRSNIVGRPMAMLMLHQHATVVICHSRTPNLGEETRRADILVAAVGRPAIIGKDMIRPGAVVIDFGANVVDDRLVGDVDSEAAMEVASYVTPVPGGTGPMTNAMLMRNVVSAAKRQHGL
ncbi:MAG: bifunctional 5,10-methylenetetrahydrofolate dehydrogenase/5,10-methenyltetrahydrofolate cyclohydrolase [Anaerolineae bacterium]|nr:bifunctional 5,10-methylenetetrahydrofolate dehydrogenase/5,10-methenyltetrahydrofolate cyclohydrolase [Anaerolineae bacterium]